MAINVANKSKNLEVQTYTNATATFATSGDNTIIAAPGAGYRLVMRSLTVENESSTVTTVLIKSGSTTNFGKAMGERQGFSLNEEYGHEWRLGANEALVVNLSGANSHRYNVRYFTEPV